MTLVFRCVTCLVTAWLVVPAAQAKAPSFDERVAAERAIAEVFWRHRIWPPENPGPKPPLSAVLSEESIRARVEDSLRMSSAVAKLWNRPVTARALQAELDRMSHRTRDPQVLRELFAALGDDPGLVADTLARETLVERQIRDLYAYDDRFHGEIERRARTALRDAPEVGGLARLGATHAVTTYELRVGDEPQPMSGGASRVVALGAGDWSEWSRRAAGWFGADAVEAVPIGRASDLVEESDRFFTAAVVSRADGRMTIETATWPKRSFDAWWAEERSGFDPEPQVDLEDLVLPVPEGSACAMDTWDIRFYAAGPRFFHTAVWTGTEMIVWGGYGHASVVSFLNTGGRYVPSTDTWVPTSVGAHVPEPRQLHTAVWTGTEMIVWGGLGNLGGLPAGGRYSPSTDTWAPISGGANVPAARTYHSAVWTGSEMIVWGGLEGTTPLGTGGRYDPSSDTWTATSMGENAPAPRTGHSAVWTGSQMIVWGGLGSGEYLVTGARYDPSSDTWTTTSRGEGVPEPRTGHSAVWTGTEMIVWGGLGGGYLGTGGRYRPSSDTWAVTSNASAPEPRSYHTAVWTGTEMIVWGGLGPVSFLGTGGRYAPSADAWVATPSGASAPDPRAFHAAVWTGTEMIVWGGSNTFGSSPLNTGSRYSPSTNQWTATSTGASVPSARSGHTVVWTGAEMIAWGGDGELNTGGRYVPSTDAWVPTSVGAGVPSARSGHTAVWTGTEMIVWGGLASGLSLDTGGRYVPSTNTWSATSVGAGVPSARSGHTAVWTGEEMIVWGGLDGNALQTGSGYSPSTNQWTATSTGANVPSPRSGHTAIWTGAAMIVWGGAVDGTPVSTGGRYAPSTNEWTATSTASVPAPRSAHTAVWTGTEMIVWGGRGDGPSLSSGGRYAPSTDTWTATATGASVPSPREEHTAVWTGTEMIVWGGLNDGSYLGTGARYAPSTGTWAATSAGERTPTPRIGHSAVWTGSEMIVWAGDPLTADVGLYCTAGCVLPTPVWRDRDADGHGSALEQDGSWSCAPPAGFASNQDDCDDEREAVRPGAPEVCDSVCNDCDGGWPHLLDFDGDQIEDACEIGTVLCDADHSGRVDGLDLARLALAFGTCDGTAAYARAVDLDHDDCVDGVDLAILAAVFGQSTE